jgi:hypothetical protein
LGSDWRFIGPKNEWSYTKQHVAVSEKLRKIWEHTEGKNEKGKFLVLCHS